MIIFFFSNFVSEMSRNSVRYTKLSNVTDTGEELAVESSSMDFNSVFTYDAPLTNNVNCKSNRNKKFGSIFTYNENSKGLDHVSINMGGKVTGMAEGSDKVLVCWLNLFSRLLTIMSYTCLVLTFPISYCYCVKKLGEFERIILFRLGKMVGVYGPGRVVVFPWIDRSKCIDMRPTAFAVPPQQFITCDGGIVEMGAEIQYGIIDAIEMVRQVVDHQDILRSLGKTLLVKCLVKKTVHQLEREKRIPASQILEQLNDQVRRWGIDVHSVTLSEAKVLKQADSGSTNAFNTIIKGIGGNSGKKRGDTKFPSPAEFVRGVHAQGDPEPDVNMSLLHMMTVNADGQTQSQEVEYIQDGVGDWGSCLESIIMQEFGGSPLSALEDEALGVYCIEITSVMSVSGEVTETYNIEISPTAKCVRRVPNAANGDALFTAADVFVSLSSADLSCVLEGSLSPLQAYLTGRITANGDVRKLMLFDKLSKRGHKLGSLFSV